MSKEAARLWPSGCATCLVVGSSGHPSTISHCEVFALDITHQEPEASKVASALAIAYMAIKQFFMVGLVAPAVGVAVFLCLASGFSFTEVSRWLVEEQAAAQQLGAATRPDHLLVKSCATPLREVGAMPPLKAVVCDEWVTTETPVEAAAATTAQGFAMVYLFFVLAGGILAMLISPPNSARVRKHALFLTSLIARLDAKGGNRE